MVHSWASDKDDPTVMPRWGKVGKQKIEDAGTLYPKRMETVDDEILAASLKFVDKAKADGKPFFLWFNPSRMHVITHLSPKYEAIRNSKNGWSIQEAGMAQLDDNVGATHAAPEKTTGWTTTPSSCSPPTTAPRLSPGPTADMTPFYGAKGTGYEGGFRCPAMIRWPGKVPAGTVENGIISGLDWFATFVAAAGNPNIVEELKKGKQLVGKNYKVHVDGYNQMDLITGKGPSARHEIFYFTESNLAAVRIDDFKYRFIEQPGGWIGDKNHPDVPILVEPDAWIRSRRRHGQRANGNLGSYQVL